MNRCAVSKYCIRQSNVWCRNRLYIYIFTCDRSWKDLIQSRDCCAPFTRTNYNSQIWKSLLTSDTHLRPETSLPRIILISQTFCPLSHSSRLESHLLKRKDSFSHSAGTRRAALRFEIISFQRFIAHVSLKPRRDLSCRSIRQERDSTSAPPFLLIISRRTVVIPGEGLDPSQCNLLSRVQRAALFPILERSLLLQDRKRVGREWRGREDGDEIEGGEWRTTKNAKGSKASMTVDGKNASSLLSAGRRHNLSGRLLKVRSRAGEDPAGDY